MDEVKVIAEAGVNHDGDVEKALALVDVASTAGADFVKFQLFDPTQLTSAQAPLAPYQRVAGVDGEAQRQMLHELTLTREEVLQVHDHCAKREIAFTATPFDLGNLAFLDQELTPPFLKIGSGDLTNGPLLHAAACTNRPVVLSTGMGTLSEISQALGILAHGYLMQKDPEPGFAFEALLERQEARVVLREKVTLLQCNTAYPTPIEDINLAVIKSLRDAFGLPVGFSDHSLGSDAAIGAVTLGARLFEKHFTLDKTASGPDHSASLEPVELSDYVARLKLMVSALGNGEKAPSASEAENMLAARRSLVAAASIKPGDVFSADNLTVKRPANGISPTLYWSLIGKKAKNLYLPDQPIGEDEL